MVTRRKWGARKWGQFKWGVSDDFVSTINGTKQYIHDLYIEDILTTEVNMCSFGHDNTWANRPIVGQEVIIDRNEGGDMVTLFAGDITNVIPIKLNSGQFAFEVECVDYTRRADKKLIIEDYTNQTLYDIINDFIGTSAPDFTINNVENPGPVIKQVQFNYLYVSECLQELADLTGYDWYIDYQRDIHFFSLSSAIADAPIELLDNGEEFDDLELGYDSTQLANRVFIRGGIYFSASYNQDPITATLNQTEFPIRYAPHTFTVKVNGDTKSVGIDSVDTPGNHDFLMNFNEKLLKTDMITMSGGEVVQMTYKYEIRVIAERNDATSQAAVKAIEGGNSDGIYEKLINDNQIDTLDGARQRGDAELLRYSNTIVTGTFTTTHEGFRSGQKLHIQLTDRDINEYYIIKAVITEALGGNQFLYTVEFATYLLGFNWLIMKLMASTLDRRIVENEDTDRITTVYEEVAVAESISTSLFTPPYKWGPHASEAQWNFGQWG